MTGYGRARRTVNGRDITVEVRSVNNRYLDCSVKMPRAYIFAEDAVKALVQKNVSRGKVDVFVTVDSLGAEETVVAVNEPLAKSYIDALRHLRQLGGDAEEGPDFLTIRGRSGLTGGCAVDCRNDHRIAMMAAVAATACREPVTLLGAECVAKSYPHFWDDYRMLGGVFCEYTGQ